MTGSLTIFSLPVNLTAESREMLVMFNGNTSKNIGFVLVITGSTLLVFSFGYYKINLLYFCTSGFLDFLLLLVPLSWPKQITD